jgi:hypothetical protein
MNALTTNRGTTETEKPADDRAPDDGAEAPRAKKNSWWTAPFRWLRKAASNALRPLRAALRPLRALINSPVRLAKAIFMATIGRDRGFGFWWLVATIAIALIIGLIVAVVLSPVIGILAAIVVGIWMLVKRSGSSSSDGDDSASASEPAINPAAAD